MSLNTPALKQALVNAFTALPQNPDASPQQQTEAFCDAMAAGIEAFVRSGDVKVTVSTTGSATAQTGTGTGKVE